jgi:hypothetical protein
MAYCIFLKSLRILEEFRKNPHIKITPKSLRANFQSLGKFYKSYLNLKEFFFGFWPSRPSRPMQPNWPTRGGGGYPSSSLSYPSTAASGPWRTDQRSTPPSMPLLNSATPPPPHLVMTSFNDCHFLLHYSSTAASPHRLTTPIKGRRLHQFSPCHPLSFPPPPKLEHCRHRASPLPPLRHCLLATTPLPEPW